MSNQKKCPECGQWTAWNQKLTDKCEHCGELLDKRTVVELQEFNERQKRLSESSFFTVKKDDNIVMKVVRRTTWVVHIIYMSIISFILWFMAWAAG